MKSLLIQLLRVFVIYISYCSICYGQQDPHFSQYMLLNAYYNPAAVGLDKNLGEVVLLHRTQWAGYSGTLQSGGEPNTQILTFSMPIPMGSEKQLGVGLVFSNDVLGNESNQVARLSVAYHHYLGENIVSFGLSGGFYNKSIDFNQYRPADQGDPLIPTGNRSSLISDFAAGVRYETPQYYLSLSSNHVLPGAFQFQEVGSSINQLTQHLYLQGGTTFSFRNLEIHPSAILKTEFSTLSYEISSLVDFNEKIYAGMSLRELESMVFMAGLYLMDNKKLRVGYAFDFTIQSTNAKQATSHEIYASYRFPTFISRQKSIIRTPRFRHE